MFSSIKLLNSTLLERSNLFLLIGSPVFKCVALKFQQKTNKYTNKRMHHAGNYTLTPQTTNQGTSSSISLTQQEIYVSQRLLVTPAGQLTIY
jgi:hypothetical protein